MDFLPFLVTMLSTAVVYGLFALAVVTALCSAFVLFQHRSSLPVLGPRFFGKPKGS